MEDGMVMLTLLISINWNLDSVNLCSNSMLNSPLLKPLHEYACTLCLKLPQFYCLGRHCFGKEPWCSPYLLQVIINTSVSQSLALLCLWTGQPPRSESSFWGNTYCGPKKLKKASNSTNIHCFPTYVRSASLTNYSTFSVGEQGAVDAMLAQN